jgi:hypothetical protein
MVSIMMMIPDICVINSRLGILSNNGVVYLNDRSDDDEDNDAASSAIRAVKADGIV